MLGAPSTGEFRDRGSKFLAYAFPVETEEDCHRHLEEVRKEHPKARHYCYAYRLGTDNNLYRANDDGEPSGTAGRPILGQLDSFGITKTLIVVVRYFGGTLLGTSGLINAYRAAAADALQQATLVEKWVADIYRLTFDYSRMPAVMNAVKSMDLRILRQEFTAQGELDIAIPQSETEAKLLRLKALVADLHLEEAEQLTEDIPGFSVQYLRTE
ncbi:MAG: YigZ family protein [Lewinellaceae bacterium]|nr:YigZ family protein [Lewinellaceae bacterium]